MNPSAALRHIGVLLPLTLLPGFGQQAPPSADRAWPVPQGAFFRQQAAQLSQAARPRLDPKHLYTLPELVDIAEMNNPETRVVWEQARASAAAAGIARSALFPTVAALASASLSQYSLFVTRFYHEDLDTFPASLSLYYTVLDFGRAQQSSIRRRATCSQPTSHLMTRIEESYFR
jgi:outer membrane protein TolC